MSPFQTPNPSEQFIRADNQSPAANPQPIIKPPTPKQQSWGTIVSLVIIIAMIVVGAFYAWGKRIAEERALIEQISTTTQQLY
ncbi:MAG: hypothetical protein Q7R54_02700 [bacterium]|nr:hypothetical protein [bacterium]